MSGRRYWRIFPIVILALAVVAVVVLSWPRTATAQCGSSASSCKNCHEVQGQDPVNSEGEWHTAHAFGDFCEFCHAGNVQATEQEAAHAGLVHPLEDVNASCLSCHPDDVQEKAEVYAVALGVPVGGPGSGGSESGASGLDDVDDEMDAGAAPAGDSDNASGAEANATLEEEEAPAGDEGEIVDYNSQYEQTVLGQSQPVNVGNAILAGVWLLVTAAGAVLVWRWEGLGERWHAFRGHGPEPALAGAGTVTAPQEQAAPSTAVGRAPAATGGVSQLDDLTSQLADLDAQALAGLRRLLADPKQANEILAVLTRLDPRLIRALRHLDARERGLLMALVEGLESGDR